jgi:hypothetical protein
MERILPYEELHHNNYHVYPTTGEVLSIRSDKAIAQGKSLLSPFFIPKPYSSLKDLFCLINKTKD